jgi:hypothetical protein
VLSAAGVLIPNGLGFVRIRTGDATAEIESFYYSLGIEFSLEAGEDQESDFCRRWVQVY